MKILTGIDLVYLPRFKKSLKNGGEEFLRRVFLNDELKNQQIDHLAGIFAAKEAVVKALDLPKDSWHDILITHQKNGNPLVQFPTYHLLLLTSSLSISHDKDYVIAQFVAILDEKSTG